MLVFVCVCFFVLFFFFFSYGPEQIVSKDTNSRRGVICKQIECLKGHLLFIACFYCTFFLLCKSVGCRFKFFFCLRCATLRVS